MAFNRVVELTAGPPGEQGIVISGLYTEFEISKSSSPSENSAVIKVYNLSKTTALRVGKVGNLIVLRAGYVDEVVAALAFGTITYSAYAREDMNTVLEIEARDGQQEIAAAMISIGRAEGTKVKDVLVALTDELGLPVVGLNKVSDTETYVNGYAFCGPVREALGQVTQRLGIGYSIQNRQLVLVSPGETTDVLGLKLTTDTGLLSLTPVEDKTDSPGETEAVGRWKIRCLLYPQIIPGARLAIVHPEASGYFRVERTVFTGDNRNGDFVVDAEVAELSTLAGFEVRRAGYNKAGGRTIE